MLLLNALAGRRGVLIFGVVALLACTVATLALGGHQQLPLLETANKLGPAAESLVQGRGLAICYGDDGTNCFRAQRMPVAPAILAGLYLLLRERRLPAELLKALFCFTPVLMGFAFVWGRAQPRDVRARWAVLGIFTLALMLPPTLDLVVNLNFEEAYFYGAFAMAIALLLFPDSLQSHPGRWAAALWTALVICYFTKSSMLPAVSFLAVAAAVCLARRARKPFLAAGFLFAFACVPLLWGLRQRVASGRFSVGTSLDGVNLYKGNNPLFLDHYPAFRGASLDRDEAALFADRVSLTDEWDENDFGFASARSYIRAHPAATIEADLRKVSVFFLGVQRDTGEEEHRSLAENAFTAGMIIFRIMLLGAIGFAVRQVAVRGSLRENPLRAQAEYRGLSTALRSGRDDKQKRSSIVTLLQPLPRKPSAQRSVACRTQPKVGRERFAGLVFLGCVAFTAAPYIAGFALTRHATVLIFPVAAYLCRIFYDSTDKLASRAA